MSSSATSHAHIDRINCIQVRLHEDEAIAKTLAAVFVAVDGYGHPAEDRIQERADLDDLWYGLRIITERLASDLKSIYVDVGEFAKGGAR